MSVNRVSPESVGMCSTRLARIDAFMQSLIDQGTYAGINTLVARRGQVVHFEQFGYQDRETQSPMTADTLFRLYSMTKPVVCAAFMTLYEQGKFDLLEPVANYIPAFANLKVLETDAKGKATLVDLKQPITIQHLLTHTSGLVYDFYDDSPVCALYRQARLTGNTIGVNLEQFIDTLCTLPLAFQPGTQWYYGVNIDVIGRLIEIISGKSLAVFLQETLFDPLKLIDTTYCVPESKLDRVATMYGGIDLCAKNVDWETIMTAWQNKMNEPVDVSTSDPISDPTFMRGGYGLKSTAADYFRFAQMLLNKGELEGTRILGPRTVDFMMMNHVDPKLLPIHFAEFDLPGLGFGLGSRVTIDIAQTQLIGSLGEHGWAGAANTYYWVDPKEALVVIFLTQYLCDFSLNVRQFQNVVYQSLID